MLIFFRNEHTIRALASSSCCEVMSDVNDAESCFVDERYRHRLSIRLLDFIIAIIERFAYLLRQMTLYLLFVIFRTLRFRNLVNGLLNSSRIRIIDNDIILLFKLFSFYDNKRFRSEHDTRSMSFIITELYKQADDDYSKNDDSE